MILLRSWWPIGWIPPNTLERGHFVGDQHGIVHPFALKSNNSHQNQSFWLQCNYPKFCKLNTKMKSRIHPKAKTYCSFDGAGFKFYFILSYFIFIFTLFYFYFYFTLFLFFYFLFFYFLFYLYIYEFLNLANLSVKGSPSTSLLAAADDDDMGLAVTIGMFPS